jgi:hypothetical protein
MEIDFLPVSLEEAYEILEIFYKINFKEVKGMSEDEFLLNSHHGGGAFIRNVWFLWWTPEHNYPDWPNRKPKLVEYFNSLGITHPDDMSVIILASFYRKITNQTIKLKSQVRKLRSYWKKKGYQNGIYKTN